MPGCERKECSVSTGICGSLTAGTGRLHVNGYFEFPCQPCVEYFTEIMGETEESNIEEYSSLPTLEQIKGWKEQLEGTRMSSCSELQKDKLRAELAPFLLNVVEHLLTQRDIDNQD